MKWSGPPNQTLCSVEYWPPTLQGLLIISHKITHTQHILCTWAIQFCPSGGQYLVGV
jgi:hypothetical protein